MEIDAAIRALDMPIARTAQMEPVVFAEDMPGSLASLQATSQHLLAEYNFFQNLFDNAPGLMCVLRGPQHIFEFVNRAWTDLIDREVIGMPVREALYEIRGQGLIRLLDTVFETGRAYTGRGLSFALPRHGENQPVERYLDLTYQPIFDSSGQVSGIFVSGMDATDRILAQEQQRLLMDELNHRVKNMLATVCAIAGNTLRGSQDKSDFVETFQARLMALSRTHNALTQGQWQGADLRELLAAEFEPYGLGQHVILTGDTLRLTSRCALSLGMVFHELAINAAKYGALSVSTGRLDIRWQRLEHSLAEPGSPLLLDWRESGGPATTPPKRCGFGSRLIERSITRELQGALTVEYGADGLHYRIVLPVEAFHA